MGTPPTHTHTHTFIGKRAVDLRLKGFHFYVSELPFGTIEILVLNFKLMHILTVTDSHLNTHCLHFHVTDEMFLSYK